MPSFCVCIDIITECALPPERERKSASAPAGSPKEWMPYVATIGLGFRGSAWGPFYDRPLLNGTIDVTCFEGFLFLISFNSRSHRRSTSIYKFCSAIGTDTAYITRRPTFALSATLRVLRQPKKLKLHSLPSSWTAYPSQLT